MTEKLNKEEIRNLLPHREPMLLIDELKNIKKLHSATAIVNVKKDSFFVQGHFPGQPVMPGVLIVEAFGQAAAALTAVGIDKSEYENKLVFLMIRNSLVVSRPHRSKEGTGWFLRECPRVRRSGSTSLVACARR